MCIKCAQRCSVEAAKNFTTSIVLQGGSVIGEYTGAHVVVHCVCAAGHDCHPTPAHVQSGGGMCLKCVGQCPVEAEKAFKSSIVALCGQVIGTYIRCGDGVHCVCSKGHECYPSPDSIKRGQGMCLKCVGLCPIESSKAFNAAIITLGGQVIGTYIRCGDGVHCICSKGHECYPSPDSIKQGHGMCIKCAGLCPVEAAKTFESSITALGGLLIGAYVRSTNRVHCVCAAGHDCHPLPNSIQRGGGMCRICAPSSYGELTTTKALELIGFDFRVEFRFKPDLRRFDFCVETCRLIIEFDGEQHFKFGGIFMPTKEDLLANQENDRQKQALALSQGYLMMRFDFTWSKANPVDMAEKIAWFIHECQDLVWVSNPDMYQWLFQPVAILPDLV